MGLGWAGDERGAGQTCGVSEHSFSPERAESWEGLCLELGVAYCRYVVFRARFPEAVSFSRCAS